EFALYQNFPNPFNPSTTISYSLPERSRVKLTVIDIRGREVITLQDESKSPGSYAVQWNGMDRFGNPVSTGLYLCRLQVVDPATGRAGNFSQTIKMVYLR
ncbi:T9SS type A sorting domain-containing protein, partial [bacterium]|nr:T9SS type A sorting domain-containing protein [bacterium]